MKTYRQFKEEATYAIENLMLEAKGFGDLVQRRKKKRKKQREQEAKADGTSLRDKKISKLASTKSHWRGLE